MLLFILLLCNCGPELPDQTHLLMPPSPRLSWSSSEFWVREWLEQFSRGQQVNQSIQFTIIPKNYTNKDCESGNALQAVMHCVSISLLIFVGNPRYLSGFSDMQSSLSQLPVWLAGRQLCSCAAAVCNYCKLQFIEFRFQKWMIKLFPFITKWIEIMYLN